MKEGRNEWYYIDYAVRQIEKSLRLDKILPSYFILIFIHFLKVVQSRVVLQKRAYITGRPGFHFWLQ